MKYKLIELDFNIPSHEIFESIKDWNEDLETSGIHKDLSEFPIYEQANR